jgi:hypothetical protein
MLHCIKPVPVDNQTWIDRTYGRIQRMRKHIAVYSSLLSYIAVFAVYPIEISFFGNTISGATSQSIYSTYLFYSMIPPILFILLGIFFAYKAKKALK